MGSVPRIYLDRLVSVLERSGERVLVDQILTTIDNPAGVIAFLKSNNLWGGSGSIADQACGTDRNPTRLELERVLIDLGKWQIGARMTNPRTGSWVDAFEHWAAHGI